MIRKKQSNIGIKLIRGMNPASGTSYGVQWLEKYLLGILNSETKTFVEHGARLSIEYIENVIPFEMFLHRSSLYLLSIAY